MAKVEQGRTGDTRNKRTGAKAPISAHPAFAVIVALWFAALLGLGSLILPIALIEKVVVATGLPALLSSAQPPLGFTARAGIALVATVAGAVIGLLVARQVARSHRTASANRSINPADLVRRPPVNAHAELGSEGFDGNGTSRRRMLALATDEGEDQANDFREAAIAPSQPQDLSPDFAFDDALVLEDDESPMADYTAAIPMPFAPPSTEDHFVEAEEPALPPFAQPIEAEAAQPLPEARPPLTAAPTFSAPSPEAQPAPGALREDLAREDLAREDLARENLAHENLAELGLVQLVQKLEATIEKHRAWLIEKNQRAEAAAVPASDEDLPEPAALDAEEAFGTIAPDEAEQAREAYFEAATPAPAPPRVDEDEQEQEASTLPSAGETRLTPIASLAGFTPEHDNEDEDDQAAAVLSASFALPFAKPSASAAPAPRQMFRPDPETEEQAAADQADCATAEHEDNSEADSASLADMRNDFARRPLQSVRIEEPEADEAEAAVVFPGDRSQNEARPHEAQAGISSEDTGRALREALRNLQRMGKAS